MRVGEYCSRDVVIIARDGTILEAAKLMRWHHVGDIVVVESRGELNIPVGIMTDRDIVVELLAEEVDLSMVSVGDAMSIELYTVDEGADLLETIHFMRNKGIRRAPVVDTAGGLVGIITVDDLIEVISEEMSGLARLINREQQIEQERRL